MEIRDKNGKTEAEFLRDYDVTVYFRPSVTVDAVLYRPCKAGADILLVKRGGHPYMGMYAFPGGFVEKNESCESAALRELEEETGVAGLPLKQLITASSPDRDPRWRNITVVFSAEAKDGIAARAGDDAAEVEWVHVVADRSGRMEFSRPGGEVFSCVLETEFDEFGDLDLNDTKITERGLMAFDHAKIVWYLLDKLGVI